MSYAEILVQTGVQPADATRMNLAADLARRFGGALTGVYLTPPLFRAGYPIGLGLGASMVQTTIDQLMQEQATAVAREQAQAEQTLRHAAQAGGPALTFTSAQGGGPAALIALARRADLTVLPAPGSSGAAFDAPADQVAMASGGPVLIVNEEWQGGQVGARILLAWNGGRESGRALRDALPLLKTAQHVEVMVVGHDDATSGAEEAVPAYLARHGCKASVLRVASVDQPIGEVLLRQAAKLECDMVVMGLYGHARLQETVLGGASRHVVRHARIPLLVSH